MIYTVTPNPVLDLTMTVSKIIFNEMTRAQEVREDWGGKGFNVSRALRALEHESVALGFVGGATGEKLRDGLTALGIATDFVTVDGETRTNVVITEDRGACATGAHAHSPCYIKVNQPGPQVSEEAVAAFYDRVRQQVQPGDLWALSGSLPPGAPADFYAHLIADIQLGGARAVLDTSGDPLRAGLAAEPYMVKPNVEEAMALSGSGITDEATALTAAQLFLEQGASWVALSMGAEGLLLLSQETRVWARPPQVAVRNPVGAGDALVAGLLHALARELPPPEQARWGVASGTAAAMCAGVTAGSRDEVEALLPQVQVKSQS